MSPLAPEKAPEPVEKLPSPPAAISEPTSPRSTDTAPVGGAGPFQIRFTRSPEETSTAPSEGNGRAPLGRFALGGSEGSGAIEPFSSSINALVQLRREGQESDAWIGAARVLKADAVRVRKTMSRHASVLLAMSDALMFTEPTDPSLEFEVGTLNRTIALLTEPFVSEPDERTFLRDLLQHGWNLVPAASTQPLTA
jgi:hypothetical protein